MQDIYYHRPRGLSTVFAKKFKIFSRSKKRFFCPPSGGGRRAFFRLLTALPRRPASKGAPVRPAVSCAPGGAPVRPAVSRALCGGPARPVVPCTPCGALHALGCPARPGVSLRALECPCAVCGVPCALWCPRAPCVAPRAPWDALCALGCPARPGVSLRASVSLAAHRAPQYRARLSPASQQLSPPPSGGPLPRPAARQRKSPAAPKGAAGPCSFRCQAMRLR